MELFFYLFRIYDIMRMHFKKEGDSMPLIIAHRGANLRAPQNTIPAFEAAIANGASGVEFDVQLSKDGVPVICHNFTVDETSNGHGLVVDLTFEELRALDFGMWFSPRFKGTQIPTLWETLETVKDMEFINIEIKKPKDFQMDVVDKTVAMVKEFDLQDKVIFSSFYFNVTDRVKELDPSLKVGLLYDFANVYDNRLLTGKFIEVAKEHQADALHPYFVLTKVPSGYINKCHENGIGINVWGIKGSTHLEHYKNTEVDTIITDLV